MVTFRIMPGATPSPVGLRFGAFELDLNAGELRKNGIRLRLKGQPLQVLSVLVQRAGEVVTREELHSKLWSENTFVDFDHGLNNAIARIRELLNDSSGQPRYIETVPRQGYRFIAQIHSANIPAGRSEATESSDPLPGDAPRDILKVAVAQPKRAGGSRGLFWIAFPGAAGIALLTAITLAYRPHRVSDFSGGPGLKSLAVLPFKNFSGDATQEYLGEGITEDVIGRLAGLHGVRVTSRTSSMHFKDTKLSAPEVAKALGVDGLVEGSVIRAGDRIRIHAQLIRAASDEPLWSDSYDREMKDVLQIESEIAESISERVGTAIKRTDGTRPSKAGQISPEAYEAYLKGKLGLHNSSADLTETRHHFEAAIRSDPTFAPAYVGLARTYYDMSTILGGASPNEMGAKTIAAARTAILLDPENAEAHALIATQYQMQWRWADAEKEYKRALELQPNDAAAQMGYARWLTARGLIDEAVVLARRARIVDPLGVSGLENGWVLFCARRYDEAIHEMRALLAARPDLVKARWYLGYALIGKGQPEQAALEMEKLAAMTNRSPGSLEVLSMAYGFAGRRADARRVLDELKSRRHRGYIPAGAFVNPYLGLHDYDQAIAGFERACQEQSPILQWIKVVPLFDPVRNDPRFRDLIRRVGLQ